MTETENDTECGTCQDAIRVPCPTCKGGTQAPTSADEDGWCTGCDNAPGSDENSPGWAILCPACQ